MVGGNTHIAEISYDHCPSASGKNRYFSVRISCAGRAQAAMGAAPGWCGGGAGPNPSSNSEIRFGLVIRHQEHRCQLNFRWMHRDESVNAKISIRVERVFCCPSQTRLKIL